MKHPFLVCAKLMLLALLSTLFLGAGTKPGAAHEVLPTIADLRVLGDGTLQLDVRVNLEAFLAGVDLDNIDNTDVDAAAADYDALRALPAEDIAARAAEVVEAWSAHPLVMVERPVALTLESVSVPEDIDFELPRVAEMRLTGVLPQGVTEVTIQWPSGAGALALRQQDVAAPFTGLLQGGGSTPPIPLVGGEAPGPWQTFYAYMPVGFDHIIPKGLDHILFVLGLFFLSTRLAPLVWQVSAFTLAHTVTLALGALGFAQIPAGIVEPLIAASIVYVAVENLFQRSLNRWRPFVIFGFGLLHGLGFASVLGEFGLPDGQLIPALLGFNVGVEIGQLTVIAAAALLLLGCAKLARRSDLTEAEEPVGRYPVMFRAVSIPGSLIIAVIGLYWCVERLFF